MTAEPSSTAGAVRTIDGRVRVDFHYRVHFTADALSPENPLLRDVVTGGSPSPPAAPARVLLTVENEVDQCHGVRDAITTYAAHYSDHLALAGPPVLLPGGEPIKNDARHVETLQRAVNTTGLDRHSFLVAIGGGALLDVAGFAAATAHRGIRLIRVPTTTLSQADSGVGVKNGINAFGKKNFLGTFAPPWAVLNDSHWLTSLPAHEWRNGIAEAVKVALIKDAAFFDELEHAAPALVRRDDTAMGRLIARCAELHVRHICDGGDPFEMGSSRPLDFGHWSAHKLEQVAQYKLGHGQAVAVGIALDTTYSHLQGWLPEPAWRRVLRLLAQSGFHLYIDELDRGLDDPAREDSIFQGLREFQDHLGGALTIQMLRGIGDGFNVHAVDATLMARAIRLLRDEARRLIPDAPAITPRPA